MSTKNLIMALLISALLIPAPLWAATIKYDLTVARQHLNMTGKPASAMTINGTIPGPTLRYSEGDLARIRVHNSMPEETSIHWHGILVPPDMDGVPLLSFPPIAAGSTFTYEFPIRQSGTYWYHSHSNMQEQSGVYGAIVITPREPEADQADREEVILFSDWTDEDPHEVMRTLKRGSERFALEKGSAQSIVGAARLGQLGAYLERDLQRMPAMDIADVAYNYFLEGSTPYGKAQVEPKRTYTVFTVGASVPLQRWMGASWPRLVYSQSIRSAEFTSSTAAGREEQRQRWGTFTFHWDLD